MAASDCFSDSEPAVLASDERPEHTTQAGAPSLTCTLLLDVLERALHNAPSEWLFFRELRVGTGHRNSAAQRLDAFALNCLPHNGMRRVCYEVKTSRSDFLGEIKRPLKRRIGMRYSNEFYFVTPSGLLTTAEIPHDCGLIEVGRASHAEWTAVQHRSNGFIWFEPSTELFCGVSIPAPWRDTPGPTWQFVAAMVRNQRRQWEEKPPVPPKQTKLELV